MATFKVRLERVERVTMALDVTVEAASPGAARRKALSAARSEDNAHQWVESDSSEGRPRVSGMEQVTRGGGRPDASPVKGTSRRVGDALTRPPGEVAV